MIEAVRRKVLRWMGCVDQAEHSRILSKWWREKEERYTTERKYQFDLARMQTALDEKDRTLNDCKSSLRNAALKLSVRNVGPLEAADLLRSAMCQGLPESAAATIRHAISILDSINSYEQQREQVEVAGAD